MPNPFYARLPICLAIAVSAFAATPAGADAVADFYGGKTISMTMGTGPGGSFDLYGRTIAAHLQRHIPGNPTIVMEHMPGAGGVIAANHIYNTAPQDGTKMLLSHAITLSEKLTPTGVRFETAKMQWLGAFDAIAQFMVVWHAAPPKTLDDLKTMDNIVIGSFARNHLTYQWASLLKDAIGAKYKIITGIRSGNENNLAMERGEIHGWTPSWENMYGTRPHWVTEKKVKFLAAFTLKRSKILKDVPTLIELAPPEKRDVAEFVISGTPIARSIALGPGVPAERVAALRKAFEATMKDPAFLADTEKRKLSVDPIGHQELLAMIKKIVTASPELVTRVKKAIGQIE
jgi:tripartite-type tricarboxylate transporter receptor subunit TctC